MMEGGGTQRRAWTSKWSPVKYPVRKYKKRGRFFLAEERSDLLDFRWLWIRMASRVTLTLSTSTSPLCPRVWSVESASSGRLLEMQTHRPQPGPTE